MIWTRGTKLITKPASEPITTAIAKEWLKVDTSAEDTLIDATIAAARSHIENKTGLALFTQTIRDVMDEWPDVDEKANPNGEFYLKRYPVQSISSVQYTDSDGTNQTIDNTVYTSDTNGTFTRIALKSGQSWPTLSNQIASIQINYVAGWSAITEIPDDIVMALRLLMTFYYEKRGDSVKRYATAAEDLIMSHYAPIV